MKKNISLKKRMMFIKGEDYNFLTYNIFVILNGLNCVSGKSTLKDHRKLSFLIDFVSDDKLISILEKNMYNEKHKINEVDRGLLNESYTNSLLRLKTINQLMYTLSNEGFINVTDKKLENLSITMLKQNIAKDFLKGAMFKIERDNLNRLKKIVQRISMINISNMLTSLYYNHGVLDEQIIN